MNNLLTTYSKTADAYKDAHLGRLCWYSVPTDIDVSRETFIDTLKANKVPYGNIPTIRSMDVFKRAVKAAETRKYIPSTTELASVGDSFL